jgi:uncharacterized membrane protein YeaQ/YmgE (transglycosylase-associated protein family)
MRRYCYPLLLNTIEGEFEMDLTTLLIQLVAGAIGGNIGGALLKSLSLGTVGNSIAGIVGGGIGGQVLAALLGSGAVEGIVGQMAGGGVGGIILMAIIGFIRQAMNKG